jgi:hypothetical protein
VRAVPVDQATRLQAKQQAQAIQQVAAQRQQTEVALPKGAPAKPRVSTLKVPPTQPVGKPLAASNGGNAAAGISRPNGTVTAPAKSAGGSPAGHAAGATGGFSNPKIDAPHAGQGGGATPPGSTHPGGSAPNSVPARAPAPGGSPTPVHPPGVVPGHPPTGGSFGQPPRQGGPPPKPQPRPMPEKKDHKRSRDDK